MKRNCNIFKIHISPSIHCIWELVWVKICAWNLCSPQSLNKDSLPKSRYRFLWKQFKEHWYGAITTLVALVSESQEPPTKTGLFFLTISNWVTHHFKKIWTLTYNPESQIVVFHALESRPFKQNVPMYNMVWYGYISSESKRKGDEELENPVSSKMKKLENRKCSDLIVLGLPFKSTEEDMTTYFKQFGELILTQVDLQ